MSSFIRQIFPALVLCALAGAASAAQRADKSAATTEIAPNAYRGATVIDAATGRVLFEDKADVQNPPASVTKLLTFAVIQDKLKSGELTLQTPVKVSAAASHIGGSRVYLKEGETFTVEDLLYALIVESANDAAYALAEKAAGSRDAFVDLMNAKARALGMTHSEFHSPHGLSPGRDQLPDLSTARDIAILGRWLVQNTDILRYTATRIRDFRPGPHHILMTSHDHLLESVTGCDGLKTGWYAKAGYSIAATVQRNGRRVIAVVLGSPGRELRDNITTRLIERGFAALPLAPAPAPAVATPAVPAGADFSSIKLVPLTPEEKQSLNNDTDTSDTVHVDISKTKK
jgi:D-alanyl-D-alanine carboxypeptidase (penicillin-binding protein 5/6)